MTVREAEQPPKDPAAAFWRSVVLLRVLTLLFAVGIAIPRLDDYARPGLAVVVLAGMTTWTAITTYHYLRVPTPRLWVVVLDLVLSCGFMATSRLILTPEQLTAANSPQHTPLIATIWITGVVAAGAVRCGRLGGTIFGAVVSLFNYGVRGYVDIDLTRDAVLLVGIGFLLGLAATTSRRSAERLAAAVRTEAATAERERLARSIHDSVLQVLAKVRKRGAELGGEAAELASLAGAQEVALRTLVSAAPAATQDGNADLGARLRVLATERAQVSVPATAVTLPAPAADELVALVREALHNVSRHAGPDARAWVLLEDLGAEVVVTVRDDGVGIPEGRIEAARAEGRMGIARSIRGRVRDLGGAVTLETAPGAGTEWEVRVPRAATRRERRGRVAGAAR